MNINLGHKFSVIGGTVDLTQTTVLGATSPFQVNGVNLGGFTPNLNSTDPAAGSGFINCKFANDSGNITLGCPYGSTSSTFAPGTGSSVYLPFSGGTLTGNLILNGDPAVNLGAATKQYVDNSIVSVRPNTPVQTGQGVLKCGDERTNENSRPEGADASRSAAARGGVPAGRHTKSRFLP